MQVISSCYCYKNDAKLTKKFAYGSKATAQLIALQKAQQILAQTGMQVGVQAPGAAAVAGGVNLGALVANMSKNYENRIYVGSLHYSITEVEIRAVFGSIGPIRMVDMSFDPLTQRSKGYCFIDFENAADAQAAMAMNGVEIAGRAVPNTIVLLLISMRNALFPLY